MSIISSIREVFTITMAQKKFVKHHKSGDYDLAIYDLKRIVGYEKVPKQYPQIPQQALITLLNIYFNGTCMETNDYSTMKNESEGIRILEGLAKSDNLWNNWAASYLGRYWSTGMLVEPDLKEAMKWFKLAADRYFDDAKLMLAYLYIFQFPTEKHLEEASRLLSQCNDLHEHRDIDYLKYVAQAALQRLNPDRFSYLNPTEWLEKAIKKQNPYAMVTYAHVNMQKDRLEALRILSSAVELNHTPAIFWKSIYEDFNCQIESADIEFISKFAHQNVPCAQKEMRRRYEHGEGGVEADNIQSTVWYTLAYRKPKRSYKIQEMHPSLTANEASIVEARTSRLFEEQGIRLFDTLDTQYVWAMDFQRPNGLFFEF
ncbi:hypothetical protein M445_19960 [Vibrio owensii 47666-1]|uniref:SEL1-like repeat protein n=1 Tax=Vibrio owensii TaxID=696485 RepID=UPI00058438B4|nr:sel1 repeat family protein [Vibrio owensii]KIF45620.1 hypothetical protein M445_19960 [Vibrio owensii 47666-1]